MKFNPDDPKWTAYVLGEIDENERAAVERELEISAEAREFVEELRLTATVMKDRLAAEAAFGLTSEQRSTIQAASEPKPRFRWQPVWAFGAVAATVVLAFVLTSSLPRSQQTDSDQAAQTAQAQAKQELFRDETAAAKAPGDVAPQAMQTTKLLDAGQPSAAGVGNRNGGENDALGKEGKEEKEAPLEFNRQVGAVAQSAQVPIVAEKRVEAAMVPAPLPASVLPGNGPVARDGFGQGFAVGAGTGTGPGARSAGGVLNGVLRAPATELGSTALPPSAASSALMDRIVSPTNNEAYVSIAESGFITVSQQQLATFSSDVDTAAYANVRRFITQNQWPPADAVRIEELINYFSYDYPQASGPHPITASMESAAAPWNPQHRLVRIGIKAKDVQMGRRASNLVFLIDVSGSMTPPERLPLLKSGLRMLIDKLTEDDTVSIVVYAGASGIALQPTSGEKKEVILRAIETLQSGGSTNGAAGIQLAYDLAVSNFIRGGTNRVILATDGDFNVGITNRNDLHRLIEERAKSNVFLTVLGFGMGNLKDATLETLADKGNGHYAYIDSLAEARKVLVEEMGSTLVTIAKDVKLQIEFNPAQVNAYRLIGYENRALRTEDFNNDLKDAGDMGAGHTVTALFEVVPAGLRLDATESLRYQPPAPARRAEPLLRDAAVAKEMLNLKIRYKDPEGTESKLLELPLVDRGTSFPNASPDFRFAASVAAFGMILRDSPHKGSATLEWVTTTAANSRGADRNGYREEFFRLVQRAQQIGRR